VNAINIPVEIAGIATAASICDTDAAQEMLDLMVSQRPFVASSLAVYNPLSGTHQTIASVGYDQRVLSHLNGWLVTDDIIYQYYRDQGQRQKALKWAEMPFAYRDTYSVQKVFLPAGFREGITLRLHSRDGRYTGNLHISTDDPRFPTKEMMASEIQCLQTILGNFTDLLRSVSGQFLTKFEGGSGCLITRDGDVIELPGVPPLYHTLSDALISRFKLLDLHQIPEVFLFKHEAAWFRVYTGVLQGDARAIVAEQCQILHGLTERELEIIELLISGATNGEIASKIFVARSTVSKHLENIFLKMGCNSRTSVVTTALASNLRRLPKLRIPA
jgi:DNA-binding CsgD family transcriptional regulator